MGEPTDRASENPTPQPPPPGGEGEQIAPLPLGEGQRAKRAGWGLPTLSDTEALAGALGRIPSGLFVLTARSGSRETGMLASWAQQCSFDPPQVSVAVRKGRYVLEWLATGEPFVLNIIPETGKALIAHFGKGFEANQPAFEGLEVAREGETPPVLSSSHAYLVCRVTAHVDAGDHVLVIGRVTAGTVLHHGGPIVHVRKNGLRY